MSTEGTGPGDPRVTKPQAEVETVLREARAEESLAQTLQPEAVGAEISHAQTRLALGRSTDATVDGGDATGPRRAPIRTQLPENTTVGRYVIIEHLGSGGMGAVYAAYDPELDRKIAIKLLHTNPGVSSEATGGKSRLLREAQAMARLTHPNVISVHDVGTVGEAVFVAMEYIGGQTLAAWQDAAPRSRKEIVAHYRAAGRGLVAAHSAGIIHRDFKPENVMVGDDGRVCVLDFGLARPSGDEPMSSVDELPPAAADAAARSAAQMLHGNLDTPLTVTGAVMGTPAYMAPEQHAGRASDERTDQFSFCVALYEALYGQRPFAGNTYRELAANVLRGKVREPAKGATVPGWLRRVLLRGLSRRPAERFASMSALLVALARDPAKTWWRWSLGAVAVAAVAAGAWEVQRARAAAADRCAQVVAAGTSLWTRERTASLADAFAATGRPYAVETWRRVEGIVDPWVTSWTDVRRGVCEASVDQTAPEAELADQRDCLARRLDALTVLLEIYAEVDEAMLLRAVELAHTLPDPLRCMDVAAVRAEAPTPDDPEARRRVSAVRRQIEQARGQGRIGRFAKARELAEAALAEARDVDDKAAIAEALVALGAAYAETGDRDKSLAQFDEALTLAAEVGHDVATVEALSALTFTLGSRYNRFDEAHRLSRLGEAVLSRAGGDPRARIRLLFYRAQLYNIQDREADAIAALREVLVIRKELGVLDDPTVIPELNALAAALLETDELDEAALHIQTALEIGREHLGDHHPAVAAAYVMLGRLRAAQDRPVDSIAALRRAVASFEVSLGEGHPNLAAALNGLGLVLAGEGQNEEAYAVYERALGIVERVSGPDHLNAGHVVNNLGNLARELGRHEQAVELHERSLAIKTAKLDGDSEDIGFALDMAGESHLHAGDPDRAQVHFQRSREMFARLGGPDDSRLGYPLAGLGRCHLAQGQTAEAIAAFEEALRILSAAKDAKPDTRARAEFGLAQALWSDPPRRARASELALAAKARLEPGRLRDEVDAWLGRHRVAP